MLQSDWDLSLFESGEKVAGLTYWWRGLGREAAVVDGWSTARDSHFFLETTKKLKGPDNLDQRQVA